MVDMNKRDVQLHPKKNMFNNVHSGRHGKMLVVINTGKKQ